jgi:ribonuclease-3
LLPTADRSGIGNNDRPFLIEQLEKRLGHAFAKRALLEEALTHRSFGQPHSERLEFLGDAVLGLIVSMALLDRFNQANEGALSRSRASLVRATVLHQVALELEIGGCVRLGAGEARTGGAAKASILGDTLEAVIAAVFVDGGFSAADGVVRRLFGARLASLEPELTKDSKTQLQELLQRRGLSLPAYTVVATRGEAHQQAFEVQCSVAELQCSARGYGSSRRSAEKAAAHALLEHLGMLNPSTEQAAGS